MNLWVLDFETFFSNEYSLSRGGATTESYIRDPQFKAHGVGYRAPDGSIGWVTHRDLPAFFASVDWSQAAVLAHHLHFDGLILSHHYGVHPAMYLCTKALGNLVLPMRSKRLGDLAQFFNLPDKNVPYNLFRGIRDLPPYIEAQVAEGCKHDVWLNFEIFKRMLAGDPSRDMPPFPRSELPIVSETIRLFCDPVLEIDVPRAQALAERIAAQKEKTLEELGVDREVLASRECFAELLRELDIEPPMKAAGGKTAFPGQKTYAFGKNDAGMKALLESEDEVVATLAAAKLGVSSTIGETRARRMAGIGNRGKATLYINYAAAHTLRPGGGDKFNPLNMPRDGHLRACLKAPAGYKIIVADKNAIECRLVNYLAGQESIIEAFRRHEDVYCKLATSIYQRPINKQDDPDQRFLGKTVELGSGYGLGHKMLRTKMSTGAMGGKATPTTEEQARLYIDTYRRTHPRVTEYWKEGTWAIGILASKREATWGPMKLKGGYIFLPNGSFLNYTTLHQRTDQDTGEVNWWVTRRNGSSRLHGPKLVENVTQALAWTITTADIKVLRSEMRIVLYPYDEIVAIVPEREAEASLARLIQVMSRTPEWAPGLPVEAEGGVMERYAKP